MAFYTTRQVADLLGVRWYRVVYAHHAGHIPEPGRVGNLRLYTEAEVRLLADYFTARGEGSPPGEPDRQPAGTINR
ncbi:MAG: helix-turn-helix domain-containing protein [Gemmataceae bacterium]|nr:helix-turn-helix domain-containing protein [Gemmataceae bacterium]